jgi:MOSC domain-containing protein YiiM
MVRSASDAVQHEGSRGVSEMKVDGFEQGLAHVLGSPREEGRVEMVVRRPVEGEREVLSEARIEPGLGVVGDRWVAKPTRSPEAEVTLMNARCIALLARDVDRWPLAGDQLYVDFDLSVANLPPGTRLSVGEAVLEVSEKLHRGCAKFSARFGPEALRLVRSDEGMAARLRGMNARVVHGGVVRTGDPITKLDDDGRGAA